MEGVIAGGREYRIREEYSRGRIASAKVAGDEIIVRLPVRASAGDKAAMTRSLLDRIIRKVNADPCYFYKEPMEFSEHSSFWFFDRIVSLPEVSYGRKSRTSFIGNTIYIRVREGTPSEVRGMVNKAVVKALKRNFMPLVEERVRMLDESSFRFGNWKVRIGKMESVWGSCSGRRLSFSIRLFFAPGKIIDYVIMHELAHLKEHNHSKRFWELLGSAMPDYRERRTWLRKNGNMVGPSKMHML